MRQKTIPHWVLKIGRENFSGEWRILLKHPNNEGRVLLGTQPRELAGQVELAKCQLQPLNTAVLMKSLQGRFLLKETPISREGSSTLSTHLVCKAGATFWTSKSSDKNVEGCHFLSVLDLCIVHH